MGATTLTVSDDIRSELKRFSWVNWSELGREELLKKMEKAEALEFMNEFTKDSEITEELALKLGREINKKIYGQYKSEGSL